MNQPKKESDSASPQSGLVITWSIFLLLTITLFFLSENLWKKKITLPSRAPEVFITQPAEACALAGGTWRQFYNACADTCAFARNPRMRCPQVLTMSCDCGPDKCWNIATKTCRPNPARVSPTPTPIPTPTGTLTPTPTPTATPIPTPTPTPPPGTQFLTFKLRFEGITSRPNDASFQPVKIYATSLDGGPDLGSANAKETVEVTPDDNGVYQGSLELESNYFGHHYRLRVKGPKHLQTVFPDVVFSSETVLDLTAQPLRPGDLDGKGYANSTDLTKVWTRLHSTTVEDLVVADVNNDQVVGIEDYALILNTLSVSYDAE